MAGNVRTDEVQINIKVDGKQVKNTYSDLNKQARSLKAEIRNLQIGSERWIEANKELNFVTGYLKEARDAAKGFGREQQANIGLVLLLRKAFKGLGQTIKGALIGSGIGILIAGLGELFNTLRRTNEFEQARAEISRFTDLTGEGLDTAVAKAKSFEQTFDQDVNQVLRGANAAANAFGEDFNGSLDVIGQGLAAVGPNGGDEFLQQVQEYSSQAEKLGLDFEQTAALIARSQLEGVFNDKGIDAIKEANFSLQNLDTATRDVLANEFGEEFTRQIEAAGSTAEKLELVSEGLNRLDRQGRSLQPVTEAVFRGAGEDAGDAFLLSLTNLRGGLEDVIDGADIYTQRLEEQRQANERAAAAQNELSKRFDGASSTIGVLVANIKTGLFEALVGVIDFFRVLPENIDLAFVSLKGFANQGIQVLNTLLDYLTLGIKPVIETLFDVDLDVPQFEDLDTERADIEAAKRRKLAEDEAVATEKQRREELKSQAAASEQEAQIAAQRSEAARKEAERRRKIEAAAQRSIEDLRLAAMEEGTEKAIAEINLRTDREIDALTGNAEQVAEQSRLLEARRQREIEAATRAGLASRLDAEAEALEQATSAQAAAIQQQIDEVNRLADLEIAQATGDPKKVAQQTIEIEERRRQRVQQLNEQEENLFLQEIAQRIELTQQRIEAEVITESEGQAQIDELRAQARQARRADALSEKEEQVRIKRKQYQEQLTLLEAQQDAERDQALQAAVVSIEQGEDPTAAQERLQQQLVDIERQGLERRLALQQQFGLSTAETERAIANAAISEAERKVREIAQAEQQRIDKVVETADFAGQAITGLLQVQGQIQNQRFDEQAASLQAAKERELQAVGDNEAAKQQIEAKFANKSQELEQQRAQANQRRAIAEAIINAALGATKTIANLGFPAAIPALVLQGIATAGQILTIRQQKFGDGGELPTVPKQRRSVRRSVQQLGYARGGDLPQAGQGGLTQGPRHRAGGIALVDNRSGSVVGEVEGGEPILSRTTYQNNREVVDALLYSSQRLGGAPIFADGGTLPGEAVEVVPQPSDQAVQAASMDTSGIEGRLDVLTDAVRSLRLVIGEQEAADIQDLQSNVNQRRAGTA